ncbi:5-hydroxyisourate hydrolase [Neobacillus niacini]|jgi:5-hydroxyisourate hydrolase|uniref:hydroxyisourate hydrolase n=1 Tax=Neobacillus niacini TaxID=86668 RepID=UPI00277D8320|nr:hydroxyisourate hydrolase [Neobacillus niacini]MDQ1004768.1 5-hydroxyisourate hydrolase [Neobacillus niacini]
MTGKLTTHVLDISIGKPAYGVLIELVRIGSHKEIEFLQAIYTNEDGRLNQPLLEGDNMKKGIYELHFYIGDYYRNRGATTEDPSFLDCVPVRFGISEPASHYHVPLLISPGGYSTYRGS